MNKLIIGNKNYSSWSLRAWLLLKQFQIPFEEIRIPLFTEEFKQKIKQYSPTGFVPTLCVDDQSIWDSLAICEYIADAYPELHCWPGDLQTRAMARSVSNEMHSGFFQIRNLLPMNCRTKTVVGDISPELQAEINRICEIWRTCRTRCAGEGDFLFGDFSIADAMYAPVVLRFKGYGIEVGEIEATYMETMLSLKSLQEWLAGAMEEQEIIAHYEDNA